MIGGELIYSVVAESRDNPVLDLRPVCLVNGALFYSLREDVREAMPHPLRDFRRSPGLRVLFASRSASSVWTFWLPRSGRSLGGADVGLAVLGSHRDPAMPLPVATFVVDERPFGLRLRGDGRRSRQAEGSLLSFVLEQVDVLEQG